MSGSLKRPRGEDRAVWWQMPRKWRAISGKRARGARRGLRMIQHVIEEIMQIGRDHVVASAASVPTPPIAEPSGNRVIVLGDGFADESPRARARQVRPVASKEPS